MFATARARGGRSARARVRVRGALLASIGLCVLAGAPAARGATLAWKGRTWQVSSGGIAGVCAGDPNNVTVDASGYLHLKIAHTNGAWSAAELFTTDKLGFGTYQWQVDGPIDTFDKNVVLGLFPYGPAAGIGTDGTNEIDIEYARWGQASGPNGDWTDYPASGTTIGELSYTFSLGGSTLSTSRFVWSTGSIANFLFAGLQPVDGTAGLIKSWTYMPQNPTVNIPQQPLPLGINLWCFDAPPSDGNPVEIVIRDFTFTPAGASTGTAGSGGGAGAGGRGGGSGGSAGGSGGSAGGSGGSAGGSRGGAGGSRGGAGGSGGASGASGTGGAARGGAGGSGGAGGAGAVGGGSAGSAQGGAGGSASGGSTGGAGIGGGAGGAGTSGGAGGGGTGGAGTSGGAGGAGGGSSGAADQGCGCDITAAGDRRDRSWIWLLLGAVAVRSRRRRPTVTSG